MNTLSNNEVIWLLDHLEIEAIRILKCSDPDPVTQVENKEELNMIDNIREKLQRSAVQRT